MNRVITWGLVPALIIASAVGGTVMLVGSAESAEREAPPSQPPIVEYIEIEPAAAHPTLKSTGVVEPSQEATLAPELSGRIVFISPSLVVGGRVSKGDTLLKIDKRNYRTQIRKERAQVRQAELELELEQAHGKVARQEWELMGEPNANGRLANREPQREVAEVKVDAARSALERAQIDLARTTIKAPFDATVMSESVEVGEYASTGQTIATLVGTDTLWVRASVPVEYLALIGIPGHGATEGARAQVVQHLGRQHEIERTGRVVRLINEIDSESRTAQVLVEIDHPFDPEPGQLPLLPGAFVNLEFSGLEVPEVISIPRVAVFEGHWVWVVDGHQLRKRRLTIGWSDDHSVFVTGGVQAADRIVVTPPPYAIDGMEVRSEVKAPAVATSTSTTERDEQAEG